MPSIKVIVNQSEKNEVKMKSDDIMKKFDNIKTAMSNIKNRVLIHEFIGYKLDDDINYDIIYA